MTSEDFTFAGATWQQFVSVPKITLSAGAGVKTVYFKLKNAGGESAVKTDTIELTSYTVPGTVVLTQYYEGLANDKHVEIANLSALPVDLASYNLVRWTNQESENWKYTGAAATSSSQAISLATVNTDGLGSTMLAPGAVIVISHNQASGPVGRVAAALTTGNLSHNGNDSLALYSGAVGTDTLMDVFSFTELGNEGVDKSFVRITTGQGFGFAAGSKITDFAAVWQEVPLATADAAIPGQGAHLGTYPDGILPPSGYATWAAQYPGIGGALDDADGDGLANLTEYATGSIPNDRTSAIPPVYTHADKSFTVTKGPAAAADPGLQYIVEGSKDLSTWSTTSDLTELENSAVRIVKQYTGSERKFYFRLKVVKAP